MKRFGFLVGLVFLWLMVTETASAMPKSLKNEAFGRVGVITTMDGNTDCGACNACNKCDRRGKCNQCGEATATYMGNIDVDGYWLTSLHAVGQAKTIWVDGVVAIIADKGCKDLETLDRCDGAKKSGCGWAVLKTAGYIPCCALPLQYNMWLPGGLCCGQDGYFVDITKCLTVTKVVGGCKEGATFRTSTLPDCPNCGAVLYNVCGAAVGILVGGGKDGCGCGKSRYTEFITLNERMFEVLKKPDQAGVMQSPALPPSVHH